MPRVVKKGVTWAVPSQMDIRVDVRNVVVSAPRSYYIDKLVKSMRMLHDVQDKRHFLIGGFGEKIRYYKRASGASGGASKDFEGQPSLPSANEGVKDSYISREIDAELERARASILSDATEMSAGDDDFKLSGSALDFVLGSLNRVLLGFAQESESRLSLRSAIRQHTYHSFALAKGGAGIVIYVKHYDVPGGRVMLIIESDEEYNSIEFSCPDFNQSLDTNSPSPIFLNDLVRVYEILRDDGTGRNA